MKYEGCKVLSDAYWDAYILGERENQGLEQQWMIIGSPSFLQLFTLWIPWGGQSFIFITNSLHLKSWHRIEYKS